MPLFQEIDWARCEAHLEVDRSIDEVTWAVPGYSGGIATLESFINKRIKKFGTKRNDPTEDALSNISPWFHFGMFLINKKSWVLFIFPQ